MESYMKCIIYLCLLLEAATVKGQILDVTAFYYVHILHATADDSFFGGYKSSTDVDATISLGRAVDTGTGPDWPPFPMESILEPAALDGKVNRVMLPAAIGLPRIGAFYVDAEKGNVFHRMIIITMTPNAGVWPESQTLTTAVGQSVTLTMNLFEPTQFSMLEWRFNGTIKPMWTSNSSVVIPIVSKADEGIYECYVVGHREKGRQGIMRLIVQECDPRWWNPPSCNQECNVCYNGGVCDPNSGHCVCPPGFGGVNCEVVFGSNSWGNDGALRCSNRQDRHGDACNGSLLCRPDPYGCSCIAGYKSIDCRTECSQGRFGAGCTQECRCDGMNCLTDTGECRPGVQCMSGWTGVNCQIPVPCPSGYYGDLCTDRCRCENNLECDQQDGYCNSGCQIGYIGPECVDDGSPKLVNFRSLYVTNSGVTNLLACLVSGNPTPSANTITVINSVGEQVPLDTTNDRGRSYRINYRYKVVVDIREEFSCLLTLSNGSTFQRSIDVNVYIPPVLTNAPTIPQDNIRGTSVVVRWVQWNSTMPGDGPVEKYIIKYRESTSDPNAPYSYSVEVNDPGVLSKRVAGLKSDTEYDFAVAAARPGEGGEGPLSPNTSATTMCDAPTASAHITSITAYNSTVLRVSWSLPPPSTWRCRSLEYVAFRWKEESALSYGADYSFVDPSQEVTFIASLKPCVTYNVQTKLYSMESLDWPWSPLTSGTTGMAVPGPITMLHVPPEFTTSTGITITWEEPTDPACLPDNYRVQIRLVHVEKDQCSTSTNDTSLISQNTRNTTFRASHLLPFSTYSVTVRATNTVGHGNEVATTATTRESVPSAPLDISIAIASFQSFTVEWLPPRNPFGNISGYDIRYWQSANRNPTTLVSPAVEENPCSLNFPRYHQIANLQRMVEYSIQVRAKTIVGPGPWSEPPVTVVTEEGAPGHPYMLTYETEETKVTLSWNRPRKPNGTIVLYHVEFRAIGKPYESNFKAPTDYKQNVEIANPSYKRHFNYIVENLEPSTRYEFLVAARTKEGRGKSSSVRLFTTGASNIPSPPPTYVAGSTSLTITLSFTALSFKYFVSYVIGVERKQRLSKRRKPDFNDSNTYITAQISKFDFNGTFTVGDGKVYGNYENRALESNRNYDIYLGVTSGHGKNELVRWGAEPLSATAASMSSSSSSSTAIWAAVGVITIAVIIVVILVAVFLKMKQKNNPRTPVHDDIEIRDIVTKSDEISEIDSGEVEYEDVDLNDQEYEEVTVSKWNIPWKDLDLSGKILGKGSFGEVQFGRVFVKDKWVKAAVKTLKEGTPESERVLFKEEFDTMTKIGYHPNVVNVLGLCDHGGTLYVVLEYVPHGNLRKFLRKNRKESTERATETGKKGEEASNLSSDQLLNFTIGVAKAMKHVTSCGVIHRDLAARNVLVGKDMKPKVADFGMSRGEDVYVQKSTQRVPTRWLAIESLTRKTYSAQSDVWSFGILLWEIATFGGTPYPDLETKYIAYKLTDGYRMPKPDNCGDDMYELMLMCWKEVPEERPTFHDIVAILTNMTCKDEIYMSTGKYENFKYAPINPDKDDN